MHVIFHLRCKNHLLKWIFMFNLLLLQMYENKKKNLEKIKTLTTTLNYTFGSLYSLRVLMNIVLIIYHFWIFKILFISGFFITENQKNKKIYIKSIKLLLLSLVLVLVLLVMVIQFLICILTICFAWHVF